MNHPRRHRSLELTAAALLCLARPTVVAADPPPASAPPASAPAPESPAPRDAASPIDTLDQTALQETFRLLRTNYIQRDSLTLEMLNRAALGGLLERLDFGAELVPIIPAEAASPAATADAPAATNSPPRLVVSERLPGGAHYLRPTVFSLEMVDAFDAALPPGDSRPDSTLVLDLRTPGPPSEFAVAARLLERFVPSGRPLFSVQKPDDPAPRHFRTTGTPRWTGRLIVLVDDQSGNVAETVAAVLRAELKAPLVGAPTPGRTMQYELARISPTHALRFASAEMRLPDGSSLFRKGLQPDLAVTEQAETKAAIFQRQLTDGVVAFIAATERPRHNEAALVAGTAPELAYHVARGAGQKTPFDSPPLQDRPLQTVVDLLVARQALR